MKYDYSAAKVYAEKSGFFLDQARIAEFDQLASAHDFTQSQVDVALQLHVRHVAQLFDPKSYTFKQRLYIALYFLFGRKK